MKKILELFVESEKMNLYNQNMDNTDIERNYKFINNNEDLYLKIKKIIKSSNVIKYTSFGSVKEFKNLLSHTLKNDEIFYDYITMFLLESFNENFIENDDRKKKKTIHSNINRIKNNIENLNIFIRRKDKLEEKNIEKIHNFILKVIKMLEDENIINRIKLYIAPYKSYDFLEIENFKINPQIQIFQKEFEMFQYDGKDYIFCQTFNSIRSINSVNMNTDDFKPGEKTLISKLISKRMYIDMDLLKTISNEYCIENNINKEDIEKTYIKLLENHSKLIKEDDTFGIEYSSKKISLYQKAIIFNFLIKNNIEFCYAPIVLDFRGRVYKTSPFSITFVKELRLCIYFGTYNEDFFKNYKEGKTDKIVNRYLDILEKNKIGENKNIIIKRALIWVFVSICENIKTKLGKSVTFDQMVQKGIDIYINKDTNFPYDKKIKILAHFKTIEMLINSEKILKRPISKDATASVYQHLIKLLGASNQDYYKLANLKSENTWYDTYEFIIDEWKNTERKKIEFIDFKELDKYFNRKTLKKTLMTQNYGCGLEKCNRYFFDQFGKLEETERKKMGKIFYNFYKYISNNPIATEKNTNEIVKFLSESKYEEIRTLDGSITTLKYYLTKNVIIDTKINNKRYTHALQQKTNSLDWEKMDKSAKANYIHTQDSALARDVAGRIPCFIIHDCFIVGCLEVSLLIDAINICFNCNYHKKWPHKKKKRFYSIFIVI